MNGRVKRPAVAIVPEGTELVPGTVARIRAEPSPVGLNTALLPSGVATRFVFTTAPVTLVSDHVAGTFVMKMPVPVRRMA